MSSFLDMQWPRQQASALIEISPRHQTTANVDPRTSCATPLAAEQLYVEVFGTPFDESSDTEGSPSPYREDPLPSEQPLPSEDCEDPFGMDDEQLATELHGMVSEVTVAAPAALIAVVSEAAVVAPAAVIDVVSEAAVAAPVDAVIAVVSEDAPPMNTRSKSRFPLLQTTAKSKFAAPVGFPRNPKARFPPVLADATSSCASSSSAVAPAAKPKPAVKASSSSAVAPKPAEKASSSSASSPGVAARRAKTNSSTLNVVPPMPPPAVVPRDPKRCVPPVPPRPAVGLTSSSSLHVEVGVPQHPLPPMPPAATAAKGSYCGKGGPGPGKYGGQGFHEAGGTYREYYKRYYKAKGLGKSHLIEFVEHWGPPPGKGGQAFHQRTAHPYHY
jgi:hypothetical protein